MDLTLPLNKDPSLHYLKHFPNETWGVTMLGTGHPNWARVRSDGYCISWFNPERQREEVSNTKPDYDLIARLRRTHPKYSQEFKNKDWGEYILVLDPQLLYMFPDCVYRPHPKLQDNAKHRRVDTTSNPIELIRNAKEVHSMSSSLLIDALLWNIPAYAYDSDSIFNGISQPDKWLTWFFTTICKEIKEDV